MNAFVVDKRQVLDDRRCGPADRRLLPGDPYAYIWLTEKRLNKCPTRRQGTNRRLSQKVLL